MLNNYLLLSLIAITCSLPAHNERVESMCRSQTDAQQTLLIAQTEQKIEDCLKHYNEKNRLLVLHSKHLSRNKVLHITMSVGTVLLGIINVCAFNKINQRMINSTPCDGDLERELRSSIGNIGLFKSQIINFSTTVITGLIVDYILKYKDISRLQTAIAQHEQQANTLLLELQQLSSTSTEHSDAYNRLIQRISHEQ